MHTVLFLFQVNFNQFVEAEKKFFDLFFVFETKIKKNKHFFSKNKKDKTEELTEDEDEDVILGECEKENDSPLIKKKKIGPEKRKHRPVLKDMDLSKKEICIFHKTSITPYTI